MPLPPRVPNCAENHHFNPILPLSATTDADVRRTCADFCAGRCSFYNASKETPTPKNLTLYRLTPRNVTDLVDHDTGDPPGDIGFFLSEKSLHAECLRDPDNIACFLAGDNVYGSWIVEVDGKFGPCACVGFDAGDVYADPAFPPNACSLVV